MSGATETGVIRDALAELRVEGAISGAFPAGAPVTALPNAAPDPSVAQRKQVLAEADRTTDIDERGKLVLSAPECPPIEQPVTAR